MGEMTHRFKVSGMVKFSIDDLITESPERAKEISRNQLSDDVATSEREGTLEVIELKAEDLGPAHWNDDGDIIMD